MTAGGDAPWVVVYDGTCSFCIRTVNKLREWDRDARFELVAYQNEGVRARFPEIGDEEFERAVQLIGPEGRYQGAAAVEKILTLVPRARPLSWVFRIPLLRPVAERVYHWVSRNRHRFGCGEHCPIV